MLVYNLLKNKYNRMTKVYLKKVTTHGSNIMLHGQRDTHYNKDKLIIKYKQ